MIDYKKKYIKYKNKYLALKGGKYTISQQMKQLNKNILVDTKETFNKSLYNVKHNNAAKIVQKWWRRINTDIS